jgi:hypothetical protein
MILSASLRFFTLLYNFLCVLTLRIGDGVHRGSAEGESVQAGHTCCVGRAQVLDVCVCDVVFGVVFSISIALLLVRDRCANASRSLAVTLQSL